MCTFQLKIIKIFINNKLIYSTIRYLLLSCFEVQGRNFIVLQQIWYF